jgi:K(+)-stimulated pyrophosphate-energized sodium pump
MNTITVLWLVIASGVLAALYSWLQSGAINKLSPGNEKMQEIAAAIQEGAI